MGANMKIKENIKAFLNKVCKPTKVVNKTRESRIQKEISEMEEIKDKEKVEEQPIEEKKDEKAVVDGENIDLKDKKVEVEIEKEDKGENASKCPECDEKEETTEENEVVDTPPSGNGIRIEDLVTKDMLADRLSAMESKMEALVNENKGLMEKLTQMSEKYEEKDFGGFTKQGVQEKDKVANSSFEDYCKQFGY